jgi:hypothetical protein
MEEFMSALDQVKKYREIVVSLTDFAIIILLSFVAALSVNIYTRFSFLYTGPNILSNIAAFTIYILILPTGIILGAFWVKRRVNSAKLGQWKSTLSEGAPGAIKLLQELQWQKIFSDIRSAKLGFLLYGISKVLAYWGLAILSFSIISLILQILFQMGVYIITIVWFSLVVVLILSKNDLRNRYEQMGRLDWLLWELRWFESEFSRANFET